MLMIGDSQGVYPVYVCSVWECAKGRRPVAEADVALPRREPAHLHGVRPGVPGVGLGPADARPGRELHLLPGGPPQGPKRAFWAPNGHLDGY